MALESPSPHFTPTPEAVAYLQRVSRLAASGQKPSEAVDLRELETETLSWAFSALIGEQLKRLKISGENTGLDELIERASTFTARGDTDGDACFYYTLGTVYDYRYSLHHDPQDLVWAEAAYRRAADATSSPKIKLFAIEKAADSQYRLGIARTQDGAWYEGLAHLEASLHTYREAASRLGRADALQQMARTHYLMGNFDKSRLYFRDALRLYQAEANPLGEANCRTGLGRLLLRLNFVEDALAELRQACDLYRLLDQPTRLQEAQATYELAQKVKKKQPL